MTQRRLAMLICTAALFLKLLVPTGYMIAGDHGRLAITVCAGTVPVTATMAMPAMHGGMADHGQPTEHGKVEIPCAFAGLSAPLTGPIDPVQLVALIAFVLAAGVTAITVPAVSHRAYLRPPLRGPPAYR